MFVRRVRLVDIEQAVPVEAQGVKGLIDLIIVQIFLNDRLDRALVDDLQLRRIEFLIARVLMIAQHEHDHPCFAGIEVDLHMMRTNRCPAMRLGVGRFPLLDRLRSIPTTIGAHESFTLRVKTAQRFGASEIGEMIAPLAIFGLVINDLILNFDLTDAQVALIVGHVVVGVPQAEFDQREGRQTRRSQPVIGDAQLPDFEILAQRHEIASASLDPLIGRGNDGVARPMTTGIAVEHGTSRLPRRRPEVLAVVVAQIDITPAHVQRDIVVAIASQAAQPRIAVERIAAGSIGNDPEVVFAAQIINPGQRRIRARNHVLAVVVVEVSITHFATFLLMAAAIYRRP